MAIKASETGNKDLIESLTGEGGPLQAGLLPAAPVKNEKALHDAFGDATKAVKTLKPKKGDSTEKAEPKTFEQPGPQEFTRKNVYLQFSVVVVQTKSPYLTQKHLFPQHDQNLVAKKQTGDKYVSMCFQWCVDPVFHSSLDPMPCRQSPFAQDCH